MPRLRPDATAWRPPQRGLFVDRWGTLLELPGAGWTNEFSATRFTRGAIDAITRLVQVERLDDRSTDPLHIDR